MRPLLHFHLFRGFVSKVTLRQNARMHSCSKNTVSHRLRLLGEHCRGMHLSFLARAAFDGGRRGVFLLDELETFEHSRRLQPLTVPILIERDSGFVVHAESAPIPSRGRLKGRFRAMKEEREKTLGKRRSRSREAVDRCFALLERFARHDESVQVCTDKKTSYRTLLAERFGTRVQHRQVSSRIVRDAKNPLFMINHTCALMRDALSRLVRRNWAHSKLRVWLDRHLWIWIAYRNYLRGKINKTPESTPAARVGIAKRRFLPSEFFATRSQFASLHQAQ